MLSSTTRIRSRVLSVGAGVHLEEPVVRRHARLVEQDLDGAEALIEGFEQVSAVFVGVLRVHSPPSVRNVTPLRRPSRVPTSSAEAAKQLCLV
jgi:hypothetical protein